MNIFEDCRTNRESLIRQNIESIDTTKNRFLYSPAHMEELAVIPRKESDENKAIEYISEKLKNISVMTNNFECLPSEDGPILIMEEHPTVCFKRVIKDYDLTLVAEENEKLIFNSVTLATYKEIQEDFKIDPRELNNILPEELFFTKEVRGIFDFLMAEFDYNIDTLPNWDNIKNKHKNIQDIISLLYNFLEKIGYKSEQKKLRSRMHDVSHGIYATACDILITRDEKF